MNTFLSTPRRLVMALIAAGAIGALGATGAGLVGARSDAHAQIAATSAPNPVVVSNLPAVSAPDFASITARNGAAVVNISVVGSSRSMGQEDGDEATDQQRGQALARISTTTDLDAAAREFAKINTALREMQEGGAVKSQSSIS